MENLSKKLTRKSWGHVAFAAVLTGIMGCAFSAGQTTGRPGGVQLGPEEEVFPAYTFGLTDFPDGLMGAISDGANFYFFMGTFPPPTYGPPESTYTVRLVGPDLDTLTANPRDYPGNAVPVITPARPFYQPYPAGYDDNVAGNGSAYFDPSSGRTYLWYQACKLIPPEAQPPKGYPAYCTIALATSDDKGASWTKGGVVVRMNMTWDKFVNDPSIPYADSTPPSVVRRSDGFLYMYYVDYFDATPLDYQIAVARLPISQLNQNPQPWKKYYQGSYTQDALGGLFTSLITNSAVFPSVTWNTFLNKWFMVHTWEENILYYRTSSDGISWSSRQILLRNPLHTYCLGPTQIGFTDDLQMTTGQDFWLYYENAPNQRAYPPGGWMVRRWVHLY